MQDFLRREPAKVRLIAFAGFLVALLMLFLPWVTITNADVRSMLVDAVEQFDGSSNLLFGIDEEGGSQTVRQAQKLVNILKDGGLSPLETRTAFNALAKLAKGIRDIGFAFGADEEELAALNIVGALNIGYTLVLLALLVTAVWTCYQMWAGRKNFAWAAMAVYIALAVLFFASSIVAWSKAHELVVRPTLWCILAILLMAAAWILYTRYALPATENVPLNQAAGGLTGRDFGSLDEALASVKEMMGDLGVILGRTLTNVRYELVEMGDTQISFNMICDHWEEPTQIVYPIIMNKGQDGVWRFDRFATPTLGERD